MRIQHAREEHNPISLADWPPRNQVRKTSKKSGSHQEEVSPAGFSNRVGDTNKQIACTSTPSFFLIPPFSQRRPPSKNVKNAGRTLTGPPVSPQAEKRREEEDPPKGRTIIVRGGQARVGEGPPAAHRDFANLNASQLARNHHLVECNTGDPAEVQVPRSKVS